MVKAIDFVVRGPAGGIRRGKIVGTPNNDLIKLGTGDDLSLNLARQSIVGYKKDIDDLVLTLVDGRQIVIDGYFNTKGEANQLYLSESGELVLIELSASGIDGGLYASYGVIGGGGKFTTLDSLRFFTTDDLALAAGASSEEATGMAMFVPGLFGLGGASGIVGAGLIGGAIIGGGGGGGGGGKGGPSVDPQKDRLIIIETVQKDITLTGKGTAGDQVSVVIGGVTQTTIIDQNGKWSVVISGHNLPADGKYSSQVTFIHADGKTTVLPGLNVTIDLTPPDVEVTSGAKSTNDVENSFEYQNGITIAGEGEVGAKIVVTIQGYSRETIVQANGTWSVTFTTSQLPAGEYETAIKVVATDVNGNTTILNDTLVVDTLVKPFEIQSIASGSDQIVNKAEADAGVLVTGRVEVGSSVTMYLANGATVIARVDGAGQWSATIPSSQFLSGEGSTGVRIVATDREGNTATIVQQIQYDTKVMPLVLNAAQIGGQDGILNAAEVSKGVTLTGVVERGATVKVVLSTGHSTVATVGADGVWSAHFTADNLPRSSSGTGSTKITYQVHATDLAQNTEILTSNGNGLLSFDLDTQAPTAPHINWDSGSGSVIHGVNVTKGENPLDYFSIGSDGVVTPLSKSLVSGTGANVEAVNFGTAVPDGSFLVVRDTDLAGNSSSTLYVRNTETITIDPTMSAFAKFDFGTIDLTSAKGNLTLNASSLKAITGEEQELKIIGDSGDHVSLSGGVLTASGHVENSVTYNIYTLGSGRVFVEDDVVVSLI